MRGRGRLLAAGVVAAALLAACALGAPAVARADEALLPGPDDVGDPGLSEEEVAQIAAPELDPTDEGAALPGDEPVGAELASRLDAFLDEAFPACGMLGVAVAVVDADGVRYLRCLGDVTSEDRTFVVGSLSKSMTAVAVMQLAEEGLVDLDGPACSYAPETGVPVSVTVRDLLNQTSGFGYFESLAGASVGESAGSFSYANANYDLLGRIVEDVSGLGLGTYLRERVFSPLGMDDASAGDEPERAPRAEGHRSWFGAWVADGFEHGEGDDAWGGPASGYVRASVSDMAAYLRMYLNSGCAAPGGARVLSAGSVHRMIFSRVPDPVGDTYYGMGWTTYSWDDGELVMSHDGQVENYVARMCAIPGRDLGVVVLADGNDEFGGNEAFFSLADGATAIAVGGRADPADVVPPLGEHVRYDVLYALAVLLCALPLAWGALRRRRGSRRAPRALPALLLHMAAPVYLLGVPPLLTGMRWRDFAAFYPDQALVLLACAILLLAGGLVGLSGNARRSGAQGVAAPLDRLGGAGARVVGAHEVGERL